MRTQAWDDGITWSCRRTVLPTEPPVRATDVLDWVRDPNDYAEQDAIESCIWAAMAACEDKSGRAVMPSTWVMTFSGFPCSGKIRVHRPPFIEPTSLQYYDGDNELQTLDLSPAAYEVQPNGTHGKALLYPPAGESFPATYSRPDAVLFTYRAGYEDENDPAFHLLKTGIVLFASELYKQRSLSVQGVHYQPSTLGLDRFWRPVF